MSQLRDAGTPDPLVFRRHRPVGGGFAPAVAISNTDPTTEVFAIAGALLVRLRGKFTTTEAVPPDPIGTLSFAYRRPPPFDDTAYSSALHPPAADANVTKDTELLVDIEPGGECLLAVTFTPAVGIDPAKVVTASFFDICYQ